MQLVYNNPFIYVSNLFTISDACNGIFQRTWNFHPYTIIPGLWYLVFCTRWHWNQRLASLQGVENKYTYTGWFTTSMLEKVLQGFWDDFLKLSTHWTVSNILVDKSSQWWGVWCFRFGFGKERPGEPPRMHSGECKCIGTHMTICYHDD